MKGRLSLISGAAIGYVLGTRAGRQRYEQIKARASSFWQSPKVQQKVAEVETVVQEKAPEVKGKVSEVARKAVDTASSVGSSRKDPDVMRDGTGI